jgi:hypothetical protein
MNQKAMSAGRQGFIPLIIILIATLVIGAGVGGFLALREKKMPVPEKTVQPEIPLQKAQEKTQLPEKHDIGSVTTPVSLQKTEEVRQKEISIPSFTPPPPALPPSAVHCSDLYFTHYLFDPKYAKSVSPIGVVGGGNTEMVGRSYVATKDEFIDEKIPIYASTDMRILRMSYYTDQAIPALQRGSFTNDYAMTFDADCGVTVTLAHLKELAPPLKEISPPLSTSSAQHGVKQISLKAGDLIGYSLKRGTYGAGGFDFVMNDQRVINQFVNQKRYESGSKAYNLNSVCPYDYFQGEMKQAYYNLLPEKNCGTMEHDKVGTISGQWFLNPDPLTGIGGAIFGRTATYGNPLPIVKGSDRITIGNIGSDNVVWIYPNNPTYKDPEVITSEHCYQNYPMNPDMPQGYLYFKIISNTSMKVFYSATGTCPAVFSETGAEVYYR